VQRSPFAFVTMTALLVLTFAVAPPGGARRAAADPLFLGSAAQGSWSAADKQLHFAGSLAIAASLKVAGCSDAQSFGGAVAVGVLKEIHDATLKPSHRGRGASRKDLAMDLLGAAAGIAIVDAMDR